MPPAPVCSLGFAGLPSLYLMSQDVTLEHQNTIASTKLMMLGIPV